MLEILQLSRTRVSALKYEWDIKLQRVIRNDAIRDFYFLYTVS